MRNPYFIIRPHALKPGFYIAHATNERRDDGRLKQRYTMANGFPSIASAMDWLGKHWRRYHGR
jgi:hypothetical protein